MRLDNLHVDFDSLSAEAKSVFVQNYRDIRFREIELDIEAANAKLSRSSSRKARTPAIKLSEEEKLLMKKLGLTQKQLQAIRSKEA